MRPHDADLDGVDVEDAVGRHRGKQAAGGLRIEQQRQLGMLRVGVHAVDQMTGAQVLGLQGTREAPGEQLDGAVEAGQGIEMKIDL